MTSLKLPQPASIVSRRRVRKHAGMLRTALLPTLAALLAVSACRDGGIQRRKEDIIPEPACGDGKVDSGEECDGAALAGASCQTRGFDTGALSCDGQCKYVTSGCVKLCGNGRIDPGEECDGALGPLTCATFGYKRCGTDCKVNSSRCVSTPYGTSPSVQLARGGVSIIADLEPKGAGDLVVAVPEPSDARITTLRYTVAMGFVAGSPLKFLDQFPALPIAADLNGDGQLDVATVDSDGTADRYRYVPGENRYAPEALQGPLDAGGSCLAAGWVGAGKVDAVAGADLVAFGCPTSLVPLQAEAFLVFRGGASPVPVQTVSRAGIVAATLGDLDGDSLLDVLYVTQGSAELKVLRSTPPGFTDGTPLPLPFVPVALAAADFDRDGDLDLVAASASQVQVLENTGSAFAARPTYPAVTSALCLLAADLDLDGRMDVAWLEAGKVSVRRNTGDFLFATYDLTTAAGAPLSLSAGDLDEDGDPELVATTGVPGQATTGFVFLNKVQ